MYRILLLVIVLIVYGSLFPWHFMPHRLAASPPWILLHSWPRAVDRFVLRDALVNVVLYVPLGVAAMLAFGRHFSRPAAAAISIALAAGLSSAIEMLQIFDASRVCNLLDLICNSAGACAGIALARFVPVRRHAVPISPEVVLLVAWIASQTFPFYPVLSRTRVAARLHAFIAAPFSPVAMFTAFAEWLAIAQIVGTLAGSRKRLWVPLCLVVFPARLFIVERGVAWPEVAGAVAGLLVPVSRAAIAAIFLAAIVVRELQPFRFVHAPNAFGWVPFRSTFEADPIAGMRVFLEKAFLYGTAVWLISNPLWVAALLCVTEFLQRYLPNRFPEITDPVLALVMALVLYLAASHRH